MEDIRSNERSQRSSLGGFHNRQRTPERSSTSLAIIESSLFHLQSLRRRYSSYSGRTSSFHDHWNDRMLLTNLNGDLPRHRSSLLSTFRLPLCWLSSLLMQVPRSDGSENYLGYNLMEGYYRRDLKAESGVQWNWSMTLSSWNAGIAEGLEEISALVIWALLHRRDRCANASVAPQSTSQRFA